MEELKKSPWKSSRRAHERARRVGGRVGGDDWGP